MISKETFVKVIRMMQEQDRANDQVDAALNLFCDRGLGFNARDKNREALMMVLKEALNDQYDYIDWWFCEAAPDYMVWSEDGEKEWCLKEPEALYDYIQTECQL